MVQYDLPSLFFYFFPPHCHKTHSYTSYNKIKWQTNVTNPLNAAGDSGYLCWKLNLSCHIAMGWHCRVGEATHLPA